jgi:parvulin-like peptidyl-prolyl isomerase/glutaredoxin
MVETEDSSSAKIVDSKQTTKKEGHVHKHRKEHYTEKKAEPEKDKRKPEERKRADEKENIEEKADREEKKEKEDNNDFNIWTIVISIAAILVIIVLLYFVFSGKMFPSGDKDTVLAKVNGEKVTLTELDSEISKLPSYYSQIMAPLDLKKKVLEQLVLKKLLLQEAEKLNLKVSDEEVKAEIEKTYTEYGLTEEEFMAKLEENGIKYEDFVDDFKEQLLLNKLIDASIANEAPSEEDIKKYYDENKESLASVKASHILICYKGASYCTQNRTEAEAKILADELFGKAYDGADFGALVKQYSDDPSAKETASLGWFTKGKMVKEFEDAAFALDKGKVSKPVKTQFGYHIIKVEDKKSAFEELKEDIVKTLKEEMVKTKLPVYLGSLKSKADIEYVTPLEMLEPINQTSTDTGNADIKTFNMEQGEVCRDSEGKPLVFMFSTTWCPHCKWITETYEKVANEYAASGKIKAYHWELDISDDTLTDEKETTLPDDQQKILQRFNPQGSVPTFIFGCKYYRIGNGYESQKDLDAEEKEFRAVIEDLLGSTSDTSEESSSEDTTASSESDIAPEATVAAETAE